MKVIGSRVETVQNTNVTTADYTAMYHVVFNFTQTHLMFRYRLVNIKITGRVEHNL